MDPKTQADLLQEMLKRMERLSQALAEQASYNEKLDAGKGGPGPAEGDNLLEQLKELGKALEQKLGDEKSNVIPLRREDKPAAARD